MDKATDGKYYGLGPNGNLTLSTTPYALRFAPSGWQEISIQNVLNMRYFGTDRSVTVPLDYVEDGAAILKSIMYTYGPEAKKVYMAMARYQVDYYNGTLAPFYVRKFTGEVDFGTFQHDGEKVNVKLVEEGLAKYFRANEKTVYELPMDVPEAVTVKDDGINLLSRKTFSTIEEGVGTAVGGLGQTGRTRYFYLTYLHTQSEGTNVNLIGNDIAIDPNGFANIDFGTSGQNYLEAEENTTIQVSIKMRYNYRSFAPLSGTGHGRIMIVNNRPSAGSTGTIVQTLWQNYHNGPKLEDGEIDTTFTANMTSGEKWFLVLELNIAKPALDGNSYPTFLGVGDSSHGYFYKNRYRATHHLALRPQYVFEELVAKVTGGAYKAENCAFLNRPDIRTKVLRSGDAIRRIEKPMLKLSFDTFFEWLDCRNGVAVWLNENNKVEIGEKSSRINWADPVPLTLTGVPKFGLQADLPFNELHVGYPEFKNDVGALNGNNEFNTLLRFSTTGMQTAKTLVKVSPIKASCYEQENIRVSLNGKDSTDNKNDNDVYVVAITDTLVQPDTQTGKPFYNIDRSLNTFITGVKESDTVYNVGESPRRNLDRLGSYLRSCHYMGDTLNFGFASGDRNSDMVYNDGTVVIAEKGAFTLGSLASPLFTPMLITVTCAVPFDLLDVLAANPNRAFSLEVNGTTFLGLPVKMGINPSTYKEQEVQLLAAPQNDFVKLIKYFG